MGKLEEAATKVSAYLGIMYKIMILQGGIVDDTDHNTMIQKIEEQRVRPVEDDTVTHTVYSVRSAVPLERVTGIGRIDKVTEMGETY